MRKALRRDPQALVGDRDGDVQALAFGRDTDRRGLRRMAAGVGEEVVQHLHDAPLIGQHPRQVRRQVDEHGVPGVAGKERRPRLVHERAHLRGLERDRERAGLETSRIQQVADEPAHAVGLLVDDAEELLRLGRTEAPRGAEHRGG